MHEILWRTFLYYNFAMCNTIPAIYGVNVPERRVLEDHIGNDDASRILELN